MNTGNITKTDSLLPSVLSGLTSSVTGSFLLLPGLCIVAVNFETSSGNFTPGTSRPMSHGLPAG